MELEYIEKFYPELQHFLQGCYHPDVWEDFPQGNDLMVWEDYAVNSIYPDMRLKVLGLISEITKILNNEEVNASELILSLTEQTPMDLRIENEPYARTWLTNLKSFLEQYLQEHPLEIAH